MKLFEPFDLCGIRKVRWLKVYVKQYWVKFQIERISEQYCGSLRGIVDPKESVVDRLLKERDGFEGIRNCELY